VRGVANVLVYAGASAVLTAILVLAPALVLTVLIEVPVAWLRGLRGRRGLAAVVLVNLITNPLFNYVLLVVNQLASNRIYWSAAALLEVLVVIAEWRLLLWVLGGPSRRMLVTSVLMNVASFAVGFGVFLLQHSHLIDLPVLPL
jgi:hypothetical protein